MQLDWRVKSLAFRVLNVMPSELLYFVQRNLTKRGNTSAMFIDEHWLYHRRALEHAAARRVLEFGAGKTLAQNLFLSTLGIEQIVVDLNSMVHLSLINSAIRGLGRLGALPEPREVASLDELAQIYQITYMAPVDVSRTDFPDASFDACISTSTLEHIPAKDIPAIFQELKRIVRPGGIISARTDYSDHYAHTDHNISEVSHLRFSDLRWWLHNPSNHYQNRLRHGHFRKMAADVGFELVNDDPRTPMPEWPHPVRQDLLAHDGFDLYNRGSFVWRIPAA